jgi:hypothetical protein
MITHFCLGNVNVDSSKVFIQTFKRPDVKGATTKNLSLADIISVLS